MVSNDIHYLELKDAEIHKVLISMRDNINRKLHSDWGYKGTNIYVGYDIQVYQELEASTGFRQMVSDMPGKDFNSQLKSRARNYAIRMTNMLHFDYSDVSKSKLLRHPLGRFVFQFQHLFFQSPISLKLKKIIRMVQYEIHHRT